jgi:alpha-D-xyloside xylohydrolase
MKLSNKATATQGVIKLLIVVCFISFSLISCKDNEVKQNGQEIIFSLNPKKANGARLMKINFCNEKIVHVTVSPEKKFSNDTSLMVLRQSIEPVKINLERQGDTIYINSSKLKVKVILPKGTVTFYDSAGNLILSEYQKGKKFSPETVEEKNFYSIQQIFDSPNDEAFYGLGQHQDGWMNYKGKDVELYQYNTKVSIPFVLSSKKYGILWDNYSMSKFGDSRDYASISTLKLFNDSLKEGGLSARYVSKDDTNKVIVTRNENDITYEYLTDLYKFPKNIALDKIIVKYNGYIQSDTDGVHKFKLYSAGYIKLWLNGKLVIDRWREAWNPTPNYFTLAMQKGVKYPVKIEWCPDGGESYLGFRALKPLPDNLQEKLSIYSEVAHQIDYYFIKGENPDDVIKGYRFLTGKAPIMPKWALGFWQSRERYKTQDELLGVVAEYRKRNIPFDNIVLDWFYWPQDKWGSQEFDTTRFPDPAGMINKLHNEYNAHIMISVWGKFYEGIKNYQLMDEKGYLYKDNIKKGRKDWVYPGYHNTFYDAMNPGARRMFWDLIRDNLFSKGVDAWWMDASEPDIHSNLPPEERKAFMNPTALGPGAQYFNAYPLCNAKGIYEGQRTTKPDQRVFILTRSAYAGQQRYAAATWSGDIGARWEELRYQIPAGLNFCISGIPYWTTDIGGFAVERKYENAQGQLLEEWRERYTRWFQYGAFCPLFRVHGQYPYREVYNISPEGHKAYNSMVNFIKIRYRLMPYIYSLAAMVYFDDYTIMRPLVMDFLTDTAVYNLNDEFMFGPSILVCPVYEPDQNKKEIYLPKSNGWYDFFTGEFYKSNQSIVANTPYEHIPIYIKAGSIVPVGPVIQYALQQSKEPVTLFVYTGADANFYLYYDDGVSYQYEKGKYVKIPLHYSEKDKKLVLEKPLGEMKTFFDRLQFKVVFISPEQKKSLFDNKIAKIVEYSGNEIVVSY